MFRLYQPTVAETLSVRGRYAWADPDGALLAEERWERYRQHRSPIEVWRAEWLTQGTTLLSHAVVSDGRVERLKLRWWRGERISHTVTWTFEPETVLVSAEGRWHEETLPRGYGISAPLLSLGRFALPFALERDEPTRAPIYLIQPEGGQFRSRLVESAIAPLGFRRLGIRSDVLRARGWRMGIEGLPPRDLWFDRSGTCLAASTPGAPEGTLVEWTSFG